MAPECEAMANVQKPPLDADVYEAISVEQHEVDRRYWTELQPLRVSSLTSFSEEIKGLPPPPPQPIRLFKILEEYACALFDAEATKYPPSREHPCWLHDLGERIEARVINSLRPNFSGTLTHHATAEEMAKAVHDSLISHVEDCISGIQRLPSPPISTGAVQLSPTANGQPVITSREAQRYKTIGEQIKKLCNDCLVSVEELADAIHVSPRSVYRHLSDSDRPSKRHWAAYEKYFTAKLQRPVRLQGPLDVERQ